MSLVAVEVIYVSPSYRKSIMVGGTKKMVDFLWKHYIGGGSMWGYLLNEARTKSTETSCIGVTGEGVCSTLSPLKEFRADDPFAEDIDKRTFASFNFERIVPWVKLTDKEAAHVYANYVFAVPREIEKNPLFMLMLAGL